MGINIFKIQMFVLSRYIYTKLTQYTAGLKLYAPFHFMAAYFASQPTLSGHVSLLVLPLSGFCCRPLGRSPTLPTKKTVPSRKGHRLLIDSSLAGVQQCIVPMQSMRIANILHNSAASSLRSAQFHTPLQTQVFDIHRPL